MTDTYTYGILKSRNVFASLPSFMQLEIFSIKFDGCVQCFNNDDLGNYMNWPKSLKQIVVEELFHCFFGQI